MIDENEVLCMIVSTVFENTRISRARGPRWPQRSVDLFSVIVIRLKSVCDIVDHGVS
jgi:hypothetical protein